jgi:D-alanyl-D-alanine carboxypeptidase (penicillin-binding protein 5/6)
MRIFMKKFLVIITFIILCLRPICTNAEDDDVSFEGTLYAKAAVLMDADSGRVLYEKNGYETLPMASTTKIMTLILTLENADLEETVTVSGYAASMPQVRLGMKKGEEYRLKDLLYSLMLESHNDSAVAIAEHVSGSVEEFARLMNEKAVEIGCDDTYYITPNGLDAEENGKIHSTTARDLALVMSYCVKKSPYKEQFINITQTRNYSFSDLTGKRTFSCTNRNAFLDMMTGAISGKTGYTGNAGYCYVGALESEGRTFVVALLACGWPNNKTYKWSDTRVLMNYAKENYWYKSFDELEIPSDALSEICITNAVTENLDKKVYVKLELADKVGINGIITKENEEIEIKVHRVQTISAPIEKGTIVGYVSFYTKDGEWQRQNIVIADKIEGVSFNWCVQRIIERCFIKK